jgi:hypothetical protein
MRISIDVGSREEGEQLRRGLTDPQVRAFVRVVAILEQLPSDHQRARVLRFFTEITADQQVTP